MQICFKIHCLACHCDFGLNSDSFSDKEDLKCPNCNQTFPQKEYKQMRDVMFGLRSISEACAESSLEKGFELSIEFAKNAALPF